MANEAVIIELLGADKGQPVRFTVADGTAIAKGTLMKFTEPFLASATAGSADVFAGIAAAAKVASDGQTELALYSEGIFDLTNAANSTITAGGMVCSSGANLIRAAVAADLLTGAVIGKAMEDATDTEVIRVKIGMI